MLLRCKNVVYGNVGDVFVVHVYPAVASLRLVPYHGCVVTLVKLFTVMKYDCAYVCMYECVCVCMCVCVYIYTMAVW